MLAICVVQTLTDHSISNQIKVCETRIIIQLTFLYSFCDFPCILGEIQVCHVGLEVANRTLPSSHAESLYAQICQESMQKEILVQFTALLYISYTYKIENLYRVERPPLI